MPHGSGGVDEVNHEIDIDEMGFGVTFATLNTTKKAPRDPAPDVPTGEISTWAITYLKSHRAVVEPIVGALTDSARDAFIQYLS